MFETEIQKTELLNYLKEGNVKIQFKKVNGEIREMNCTLNENVVNGGNLIESSKTSKKKNPDVIAVWDIEMNGWRSMRWENIIKVDIYEQFETTNLGSTS
jgi:hypothetical protein